MSALTAWLNLTQAAGSEGFHGKPRVGAAILPHFLEIQD